MFSSHHFGNPSFPTLIFLHGLLGSTEDFLPIITKLQERFYCISLDLPGHGTSPLLKSLTFKTILKSLKTILIETKCSRIIGYSLGGRLAMCVDSLYPSLLHKIAILSSHPGLDKTEKKTKEKREKAWYSLLQENPTFFIEKWYAQPLFKTLPPSFILQRKESLNSKGVLAIMKGLSITKQPSLWSHLKKTKTNYLFLSGAFDETYSSLYQNLPHPNFSIPNASHAIHLENPSRCIEHLETFFLCSDLKKFVE